MFRAMFSPIIRSTWLYLHYLVVFTQVAAAGSNLGEHYQILQIQSSAPDDGRKHRLKHVELTWNNKLTHIVHLVGYFHSCITMHGFMKDKCLNNTVSKNLSAFCYYVTILLVIGLPLRRKKMVFCFIVTSFEADAFFTLFYHRQKTKYKK